MSSPNISTQYPHNPFIINLDPDVNGQIPNYSTCGIDKMELFERILGETFEIMYGIKIPEVSCDWGPVDTVGVSLHYLNYLFDQNCHYPPLNQGDGHITPSLRSEVSTLVDSPPVYTTKVIMPPIGVAYKCYCPPAK